MCTRIGGIGVGGSGAPGSAPDSAPGSAPDSAPGRAPDSAATGIGVLRYSPGYCGWHISGQRRLFAHLRPERIGITLHDSYLMEPLKSVSGVLIAGAKEIHAFADTYPLTLTSKE